MQFLFLFEAAMTQQTGDMRPGTSMQQVQGDTLADGETRVLPVLEEQLDIRKVAVETGAVRVRKIVHEESRTVDMSLMQEEVSIARVPVNKVVEEKFQPRQERDTRIVPIFRGGVTTRLVLGEDVHIATRRSPDR